MICRVPCLRGPEAHRKKKFEYVLIRLYSVVYVRLLLAGDKSSSTATRPEDVVEGLMGEVDIDKAVLERIERDHPAGMSSAAILDLLSSLGVRFSEATLRKWVQLGLLPRSVRVGRKGKHSGSQGMYPTPIVQPNPSHQGHDVSRPHYRTDPT